MAGLSDYSSGNLLAYITGKTAVPSLPQAFVALFQVAPTSDAGTGGTEVPLTNAYARKSTVGADWNTPTASVGTEPATVPGFTSNANTITFTQATGAGWGTVTAFGLYDSVSAATNLLAWDYLGNFNWLPATMTLASPGVVVSPAHGYSNGDVVVVTTKYGGALPTLSQGSFSPTLLVSAAVTDSFTLTTSGGTALNSSTSGDFQIRKVASQAIPGGVQASFAGGAPGALVLTLA